MNKVNLKHIGATHRGDGAEFEFFINDTKVDLIDYDIKCPPAGRGPLVLTVKIYADPDTSIIDIKPLP